MSEDILNLIDNLSSPDDVIRNMSANIFLSLKDEGEAAFIFENVKNKSAFVKSMFIRLLTILKKESARKYLTVFLSDADRAVREEALSAVKKISPIFMLQDYRGMIMSASAFENMAALEMLSKVPETALDPLIVDMFVKYPAFEERRRVYLAALEYCVAHKKSGPGMSGRLIGIMKTAFAAGDYDVLKMSMKWAHLMAGGPGLIECYSMFLLKNPDIDEAIVRSALKIDRAASTGFIENIASENKFSVRLRGLCFQALVGGGKDLAKAFNLMGNFTEQPLKYIALQSILNVERRALESHIRTAPAAVRKDSGRFERLILFETAAECSRENLDFLIDEYKKMDSEDYRAVILSVIYKKQWQVPSYFLDALNRGIHDTTSPGFRYYAIALLVSRADLNGAEFLFNACSGNDCDFAAFAEAYVKRAESAGVESPAFYRKFLSRLFKSRDYNLISAAIASMPGGAALEFVREFMDLLFEAQAVNFIGLIKSGVVSILLKNSSSLEYFLDAAENEKLPTYISILRETGRFDSLRAIVRKFFDGEGRLSGAAAGHVLFMVRDAFYSILKNNINRIYEMVSLPQFGKREFMEFAAPITLKALEDVIVSGASDIADLSFLVKKTPESVAFYRAVSGALDYEDRFFLYNVLQKYDGAMALELIGGLK